MLTPSRKTVIRVCEGAGGEYIVPVHLCLCVNVCAPPAFVHLSHATWGSTKLYEHSSIYGRYPQVSLRDTV